MTQAGAACACLTALWVCPGKLLRMSDDAKFVGRWRQVILCISYPLHNENLILTFMHRPIHAPSDALRFPPVTAGRAPKQGNSYFSAGNA